MVDELHTSVFLDFYLFLYRLLFVSLPRLSVSPTIISIVCLTSCYRDFLPRGSGIVTRRPLVLQLMNAPTGKNGSFFSGGFCTHDGICFTQSKHLKTTLQQVVEIDFIGMDHVNWVFC